MYKRKKRWLERRGRRRYQLEFLAQEKQRESELKLNRRKFRRVVDTHTGRNIYYISDKDGIMYEIQQGLVDSIEYFPRKRYDNLYCERTVIDWIRFPAVVFSVAVRSMMVV